MTDRSGPRARRRADGARAGGPTRPARRKRGLAYRIVTRTLLGLLTLGVLGMIVLFVIYQRTEIPQPNADATKQQSILYYDDGVTELARFNSTTRQSVTIDKVPEHVRNAFLSAEDRDFYTNQGVSPTGIVRAFWSNVRGSGRSGGSTITQQYVKNYFLTQDKTLTRKFNEVMISLKIDQKYSKDQILADYLNTIYFGRGAYGIQAASQAYFNKDVGQLSVSEGAFLASIVNSPTRLDPANGQAAATRVNYRMSYVLGGMVEKGWLTQSERAQQQFPIVQPRRQKETIPGPLGYVRELVRKELTDSIGLSDVDVDKGGLRITTTINKKSEDAAIKAVRQEAPEDLHVGLVAQKPGDGAVVAIYAGADPTKEADNATYQLMQGASNFKVFTLIGALEDGMSLSKTYLGDSPMRFKEYVTKDNPTGKVTNFDYIDWGRISLRKATANSVNTVFLQVNQDIGPEKTAAVAKAAGIPDSAFSNGEDKYLSNVLGTPSVHVLDMATAYNTINAQGIHAKPYYIKKITSSSGYTYNAMPQTNRAIDQDVALQATSAMQDVVTRGSAERQLRGFERPAAGKTGTSNQNRAIWFSGFTPQLTTSVGMFKTAPGSSKPIQMTGEAGDPVTGSKFPTQVWRAFMDAALEGLPAEEFADPPGLEPTFTSTQDDEPSGDTSQEPTADLPTSSATPPPPSSTEPPTSTSTWTQTRTRTSSDTSSSTEPHRTETSTERARRTVSPIPTGSPTIRAGESTPLP